MSRLQEEDDPYLIEEPSDEEPAQSSSEDEVDVLLHGTPEQKRKLIRECLTGESESSSDDEFQKEMEAELDCTMKNMEGKWKSQLSKQDEPLSNIQYIDSSSKGVHLPSGPLDCDHPSSRSRDLTTELSQPVAPRATPRYHHQGQQFPQHAPFLPTSCNTYHDPYYSAHFQHEDCDSWDYSYSHFRSPPQRRFVRSRSRHRDRSPSRLPPPQYWDQPCHSRHRRYHPDYCSYRRPPPSPTVSQPPWGYDLQPASSSNVRLVPRVTAPESTMMDPVPALVEEPIPFPTPTLTPTVIPAATTEPPPDLHLETVVDFEPFASSDSESDVSFSLDAFSSSSPSELVGGNRPDSPPDYLYTEQVTRMATSLGIEVEQQHPWVKDPVFDMMNTAVALPMPPRLIETVKSFWDKPSSRSPTSHYLETMYRVQEQDCSFLFRHPVTNSVVVKAAQSSNRQKALATPTDHEGHKLDIMGRKFYSTAALQLRIADYQACMSRYQYFLWEKLTPFFEYLPEDKRKLATGFQNEAFDLARQQICSTLHLGDCASRVMASAISLRRHAWLRSSGLDPETCSRIEDLPFNGDVLFGSRTNDIVKRAQKRRSTVRSRGLAQHQSRSRRRKT
ncbi:E2F-associated phosphoprotein isoform X1 [Hemicordylus capensis]|uniref:E2F-associated phosphoprotein isoform X1 n=1 Tax=Hemicordylus capensis TaxID=884348 RepID=UPI00230429A8|nr:E2F-associated phosphoprotein isoform X1 [Hemicordylus capensis]